MFDGSSIAGKRFRAARSLSTDEPARPTGEPTRLLYGHLKPKKRPPRGTIFGRAAPPNRHADALDVRRKLDSGKTLPRGAVSEYRRAGSSNRRADSFAIWIFETEKHPPRGTIFGRAAPPNRHADALDDRRKLDGGKTLPRGAVFEYRRAGSSNRRADSFAIWAFETEKAPSARHNLRARRPSESARRRVGRSMEARWRENASARRSF